MRSYPYLMLGLALLHSFALAPVAHAQDPADGPSPGAPALRVDEVHGRWMLTCLPRAGQTVCAARQVQKDRVSGRQVLLVELRPLADGSARGGFMLPPSLRPTFDLEVKLDGAAAGQALPIRRCEPKGCAVTFTFAAAALARIRAGRQLRLRAVDTGGTTRSFVVDLSGLSQAIDRGLLLERRSR